MIRKVGKQPEILYPLRREFQTFESDLSNIDHILPAVLLPSHFQASLDTMIYIDILFSTLFRNHTVGKSS